MVKHQRRSHQRGIHSSELDDCTSESGSDDSPSTPKNASMHWPPPHGVMPHAIAHSHVIHRAASFADFGQGMTYPVQHYGHRQSMSTSGIQTVASQDSTPIPATPAAAHQQQQAQAQMQQPQSHPGVHVLHRTASMPPHSYYVTEQNNPGVATMNTNPQPVHQQYHQIPRQQQQQQQQMERLPLEIPYTGPGMTASIQSSPSSYSAASGRSPSAQDAFYTHAAPAQAATYALHTASPVEQQASQMVSFQSATAAPPAQMAHPAPQPQPAPTPEEHWYSSVPYQPPTEIVTIGQIPSYGSGVYDPWATKIEFEDPSMQMPSARIESM
jgi:metal regulatory transcription factor 1